MTKDDLRQALLGVLKDVADRADPHAWPVLDKARADIDRIVDDLWMDGLTEADPVRLMQEVAGQARARELAADGAQVLAENDSGMWLR